MEPFLEVLENDLRLLTTESRKSEGLTQQLTGWLSNNELPQIKEAAERALLKLRSVGKESLGMVAVRNSKVSMRVCVCVCAR